MRKILIFTVLGSLLWLAGCRAKPRIPAANNAPKPQTLRRDVRQLPFKEGEKLTYELRFTRIPISVNAGSITFEFVETTTQPKIEGFEFQAQPADKLLHLRALIVSQSFLLRLFGLNVNDRFETLINASDFRMRAVLREIQEGKKHNLQSGYFNYEQNEASYRTTDLNEPQKPAREQKLQLEPNMQDLLSAFYLLRLQELKDNTIFTFPLVYEGTRREFDIVVHQREELKIDLGTFKAILTEPKVFGPNRLSGKEGEFYMWLSDDAQRIPLRLSVKSSGATITATLIKKE